MIRQRQIFVNLTLDVRQRVCVPLHETLRATRSYSTRKQLRAYRAMVSTESRRERDYLVYLI
jgi:hypothetical protein